MAAVTVESEKLQAAIIRGEQIDHENLVRLNNLQARLVKQLDIKPKGRGKPRKSLADIMQETGN